MPEKWFADPDRRALDDVAGEFKIPRGEHDNGRTVFEITEFLALGESRVAGYVGSAAVVEIQRRGNEMQPDACHKNRGNRHDRQTGLRSRKFQWQDRPLILTEEPFDAFERDWIDIPRISGNVSDAADSPVAGSVKPVVHARPETERDELAASVPFDQPFVAQQVLHTIRKALRLNRLIGLYRSEGSNNRVAWTCNDAGIWINAPRVVTKLTHKAVPDAWKFLCFGFFKPQVVKKTPDCHRQPCQAPAANSTEPADQERRVAPGNSVCDKKVDVFLEKDLR